MKPNKLTKMQIRKLQKKFPKKKLTKEELELKRIKKRNRIESICEYLIIAFFGVLLISALLVFYLMWNYKW